MAPSDPMGEMFTSQVPPLELFVRGSFVYLGILLMLRMLLRREAASITVPDLLMVVLIGDAGQNAMAKDYHTLTDGAVLIATIVFWNYALDRLAFRFRFVEWFVHPPPLPLVRKGRVIARNLRRESISRQEPHEPAARERHRGHRRRPARRNGGRRAHQRDPARSMTPCRFVRSWRSEEDSAGRHHARATRRPPPGSAAAR